MTMNMMTNDTTRYTINKFCIGCGFQFSASSERQLRCKKNCSSVTRHVVRAYKRATALPEFVAVDGEGVQIGTEHKYVLLSVGPNSLHRNGEQLQFTEIMEFLYSCYNPVSVYVGYFLNYDFTQWLRTLPEERARMLLTKEGQAKRVRREGNNPVPFPVRYNGWEFDLLAGRRWKLRPENSNKPWMYICDVGGYFQMAFTKASAPNEWIDKEGNHIEITTPAEQQIIAEGKAKRATAQFDEDMILYNQTENATLERMMCVMARGFKDIDIKLNKSQWIGPGQAVQAWMRTHNTHTRDAVSIAVPPEAADAARRSFFGGWFEIFRHGHIPGTVYEYDINSAYPSIHSKLPCLLHGEWKCGEGKPFPYMRNRYPKRITLVEGYVRGWNTDIGAMLHRTPQGKVFRPQNTRGVYWLHELEAAMDAGLIIEADCKFEKYWSYKACECVPPMAELAMLFETRLLVGKNTPQGKALKLLYNSAYGKTAQSVGAPKFANPIHASLITAGCRTMILRAIATHPNKTRDVVMIATDGIYFRSPHPTLDIGKKLGQWEAEQRENMCLIMPGIYWDNNVRNDRARAKIKSRGINANALIQAIDEFDDKFSKFDPANPDCKWPVVNCTMNFAMVTAKQALQRNDYSQCGFVQQNYVKKLNSNPISKRLPTKWKEPDGTIESLAYILPEEFTNSAPYEGRFGEELRDMQDAHISDDGMTMDASFAGVLYDAEW